MTIAFRCHVTLAHVVQAHISKAMDLDCDLSNLHHKTTKALPLCIPYKIYGFRADLVTCNETDISKSIHSRMIFPSTVLLIRIDAVKNDAKNKTCNRYLSEKKILWFWLQKNGRMQIWHTHTTKYVSLCVSHAIQLLSNQCGSIKAYMPLKITHFFLSYFEYGTIIRNIIFFECAHAHTHTDRETWREKNETARPTHNIVWCLFICHLLEDSTSGGVCKSNQNGKKCVKF